MTNSRVAVTSDKAPKPYTFLSQAIVSGGHIFCSGQVGTDPETGNLVEGTIQDRTRRILTNIQAVLGAAGATLGDVVKVNIYLADMSQFAEVNAVYETFFESPRPARTCVSVKGLPYGTDVEMECVANAVVKA
ncbi:endoribonuclease L-PSP [Colletotrichum higginsianum]|uniref:Endoribonuclease L-PSP n=2 Tax=Colletotrichum higginsianum TaxID=80884 RepID=H1VB59_COLHI|nr:Endoribonuclease L-PSP [Colletotrichum higginsianum IMI 349063]OBR03356.1 Endoribonuclease L-PSP [Colletotrichum higginsianum IMI 349063]TIC89860.1 RutC family protein [Colletotrichum higginsianum]CCF37462.1 endoribonuclease L-PSP [Colletotrichum higginsianum]